MIKSYVQLQHNKINIGTIEKKFKIHIFFCKELFFFKNISELLFYKVLTIGKFYFKALIQWINLFLFIFLYMKI